MKLPIVLVNFKSFSESTGENAVKLSRICESVSNEYKIDIGIAPSAVDIYQISQKVKISLFSQNFDPVDAGQFTGHVTAQAVKKAGAIGSFINHSEKRLTPESVGSCIQLAKKYKLISVVFASTPEEAEQIAKLNPDFIAIEPPGLIGTGISVSTKRPGVILKTVKILKRVNPRTRVLTGAGITTGEDVRRAIDLGTCGVVVASGVVKAENPRKILAEFAKAIR